MPGFDKSGPTGNGPRTGRGMGQCAGGENSSDAIVPEERPLRGVGRGGRPWGGGHGRCFGRGRGRGGGRGQGWNRRIAEGGSLLPVVDSTGETVGQSLIEQLFAAIEQLTTRVAALERPEEE